MLSQLVAKVLSVVLKWTSTRTDVTTNASVQLYEPDRKAVLQAICLVIKKQTAGKTKIITYYTA